VPSLGDLVDQVINELHGHTTDQPAAANLVGAITASGTELALDFGGVPWAGRPNGIVEIGDELLLVSSFDSTNGVATVPPWGRGYRGTVAQAHDADSMVTVRPRYPRKHVARVINQVVAGSSPPLYAAVDMAPFETGAFVGLGFDLPTNTLRVLRVEATETNLPEELTYRRQLRDWTVRNVAGTQKLQLDRADIYETIQVTVAATPGEMTADTDDFETVTGLSASAADMVVFGALSRLILGADLARQQTTSVEAQARSEKVPAGSATTIARFYEAKYAQRLEFERDRLQQMYPLTLLRRG
jgi:hypothetical protein